MTSLTRDFRRFLCLFLGHQESADELSWDEPPTVLTWHCARCSVAVREQAWADAPLFVKALREERWQS